jgi:hypothetical protein
LGTDDRRARWLAENGFSINVASRYLSGEPEATLRRGFAQLFAKLGIALDADDPVALMIFPEMDATVDVPEITEACWGILGKSPESIMCATSRMVVKHKGAIQPSVIACTLLPYDPLWNLGPSLVRASWRSLVQPPALRQILRAWGAALQPGLMRLAAFHSSRLRFPTGRHAHTLFESQPLSVPLVCSATKDGDIP